MRGVRSPIGSPPQIRVSSAGTSLGVIILATAGVKKAQRCIRSHDSVFVAHLRAMLFGTGAYSPMLDNNTFWSTSAAGSKDHIGCIVGRNGSARLVVSLWQFQDRCLRHSEPHHIQAGQLSGDKWSDLLHMRIEEYWTASVRDDQ
ncbi:hypothetical protein HG530_011603 [Fusarium avenaceum]|nr:hypothetical protein HG530_011603 [Fusarium avenaceum]